MILGVVKVGITSTNTMRPMMGYHLRKLERKKKNNEKDEKKMTSHVTNAQNRALFK